MGRAERRRMERSDRIENRKGKLLMSKSDLKDIRAEISENNVQVLMTCFASKPSIIRSWAEKDFENAD